MGLTPEQDRQVRERLAAKGVNLSCLACGGGDAVPGHADLSRLSPTELPRPEPHAIVDLFLTCSRCGFVRFFRGDVLGLSGGGTGGSR